VLAEVIVELRSPEPAHSAGGGAELTSPRVAQRGLLIVPNGQIAVGRHKAGPDAVRIKPVEFLAERPNLGRRLWTACPGHRLDLQLSQDALVLLRDPPVPLIGIHHRIGEESIAESLCQLQFSPHARHLAFGSIQKAPRLVTAAVKQAIIETDGEIVYHVDGEPGVAQNRVDISIKPGVLRVKI